MLAVDAIVVLYPFWDFIANIIKHCDDDIYICKYNAQFSACTYRTLCCVMEYAIGLSLGLAKYCTLTLLTVYKKMCYGITFLEGYERQFFL